MSDRRAVSAAHLGASSVAAAHETWRVAVGGNRVEAMTVEQIAHAFHSGQLNVRTPLWPPGATGWQALGNYPEFQQQASYAEPGLAQFAEADDDPTRMWTGGPDAGSDLASFEAAMQAPFGSRPPAQTGVRQVVAPRAPAAAPAPNAYAMQAPPVPSRPGAAQQHSSQPMHSQPMHSQPMHSQPMHSQPMQARPAPSAPMASHQPALVPSSMPPFRSKSRGNALLLVAGLVGLVGLGSAVLAARGSWGSAAEPKDEQVAVSAETSSPPAAGTAEPAAGRATSPTTGEAQLAKYEDKSAFVAGEAGKPVVPEAAPSDAANTTRGPEAAKVADSKSDDSQTDDIQTGDAKADDAKAAATTKAGSEERDEAEDKLQKASRKSVASRNEEASSRKPVAREKRRAALPEPPKPAPRAVKVAEKADKPEAPEKADKPEKAEKPEKAVASEPQQAPANAAVNEAAAAALANSASLAASCRPRGGPAGAGKARVIYSNDGDVQSVEILTAKFRDTLTGSCVRMVFRRAKIPPFKGEPPTFIKSFTIPEE